MREMMLTLLILLVYNVYIVTPTCRMQTYTPPSLFQFAQQIFWDPRTNSIYLADTDAPKGSPSIFRFDWKSRTWHGALVTKTNAKTTTVSFVVPASSSTNTLIAGQSPCVILVNWDGVSSTATRIEDIACHSSAEVNPFDRGATSPKGTLYMSILPTTYCNKTVASTFPAAAIEYLELGSCSASIKNALTPGTYSNGIVFDSTTNKCYIADDCSATVLAYRWNPTNKALTYLNPVFSLPRDKATTNYPSGMVIDQCSNLYVGDHNSGRVYYVNSKTGKVLKKYTVPGTHVTAVGIVGPNLDYLCVITGIPYHDIYGNLRSNSTDPGDGKMYLIPICSECSGHRCKGKSGVPVAGY